MTGIGPRRQPDPGTSADAGSGAGADPGPDGWADGITQAEAMRAAEMSDLEGRYRQQLARESFEAGRLLGRAEHVAEVDAGRTAAYEVPDPETIDNINKAAAKEHAEFQERRWGPGGRYHFADAQPGDYMGGPVKWEPEPEPEAEAG